jgi:putative tryptophan/tyrosine transport system substrate-binding protein
VAVLLSASACSTAGSHALTPPAGRAAHDIARDVKECTAASQPGVGGYARAAGTAVGTGLALHVVAPIVGVWTLVGPSAASPPATSPGPLSSDPFSALLVAGAISTVVGLVVGPVIAMQYGKEALQDAAQKELDQCLQSRGYVEPPAPSMPQKRVLVVLDDATEAEWVTAFFTELNRRQHAIGKTSYVEVRSSEPEAADRSGWDVVVAGSARLTESLRGAIPGTPVVTAGADVDPAQVDLAAELNRERLELLRVAAPSIDTVAVLANPNNPAHAAWMTQLTTTSGHVAVIRVVARTDADLPEAFASASAAAAIIILPDREFRRLAASIASHALRHRLLTIAGDPGFADAGGLFAYHPSPVDGWREAAVFVHRFLTAATPGSYASRTASAREFVVNVQTAEALGITLPPRITLKATRIIR